MVKKKVSEINLSCKKNILKGVSAIYKKFPKNIIFPKLSLLNRRINSISDLKSSGPLQNLKPKEVHIHA
jgi:hypothetical protein